MATGGAESVQNFPEAMREAFHLDDLTSAAGYLQSSVFGLILPLLALFYGAATGARVTAGDEESGTLDLLLAHPVTRTRLILQRFGALAMGIGAATGRRALVFAATAGIGILTYAAHTFAGRLGADWAKYFSPFHYYIGGEPLKHGIQWADAGTIAVASAALVAAGTYRFNDRDLNA